MFEIIEEKLGIPSLNNTIDLKKCELQQLKQELCEKINLIEKNSDFMVPDFLKTVKKLINYYLQEDYMYKIITNKKNSNTNSYIFVLCKNVDITDSDSVEFWNNVENGNIIVLASKVSKIKPLKISFIAKKIDKVAKFNFTMKPEFIDIIVPFFEFVIESKINNNFVSLEDSFNKFITATNKKIKKKEK